MLLTGRQKGHEGGRGGLAAGTNSTARPAATSGSSERGFISVPSQLRVVIRNREELETTSRHGTALDCVEAGIAAAHPRGVVADALELDDETLSVEGTRYDLDAYEEVVVLGGGKAAAGVASALEELLGDRIARGAVVTDDPTDCDRIEVREGDHPVPSERGVAGARRVLELADDADEETLVLAVLTGGGSALLPAPADGSTTVDGLELSDVQGVTDALLSAGAEIAELNAVRKHCSALKGGRLAARAAPATVVGLLLSDVVGDDPSVIASGPLTPDATTYADALAVLDRYGVDAPAVRDHLARGADGLLSETPSAGDPVFERVSTHVVADSFTALDAAADAAREQGYDPLVLSSRIRGEAREAAKTQVAVAEEMRATGNPVEPPTVVLSGGETTVTVRGDGEGGPNLELALSAALELDAAGVVLASVDTDGRDGGTDVAGAIVDADAVETERGRAALSNSDALAAFEADECVIRTGPTGTNVNDLRVVVVDSRPD